MEHKINTTKYACYNAVVVSKEELLEWVELVSGEKLTDNTIVKLDGQNIVVQWTS